MQKRLLILGGADFQIPFIKKAKDKGLYVGVVDINADAPGKEYADYFFQASVKDKEEILSIAKAFQPDGVTVGMVDIAVPACAYVATELGLPGMDMETAVRSTNKFEMIRAFEENHVPHPAFQYLNHEDIGKAKIQVEYPLIVKPVDMAGSRGIFLVNNDVEMEAALEGSSKSGDSGNLLIEEYMDGPEVSVELVVKNGTPHVIQITDKTTSGAPHFAETGHLQPSQLPEHTLQQIAEVARGAAKALQLKNSLGHAEIKVTSKGPKMVEIGARAGGDSIGEQLIELSSGVSFPEVAISIALGEDFEVPQNHLNLSSCIRFLTTQNGVLASIEGADEAKKIHGVQIVKIFGKIGKQYSDMIDSSGRLGYIITQAENADEARHICNQAFDAITVNYK